MPSCPFHVAQCRDVDPSLSRALIRFASVARRILTFAESPDLAALMISLPWFRHYRVPVSGNMGLALITMPK